MKTRVESVHVFFIASIVIVTYYFLFVLANRYFADTLAHLFYACKLILTELLFSKTHILGTTLIIFILVGSALLVLKTLFTFIKTQRKIKTLLKRRTLIYNRQVRLAAMRIGIDSSRIIVVETKSYHAFSFGILKPRIVVSSNTVKKLSKNELEAVLLHEASHVVGAHVAYLLFAEFSRSLLFFIPIVRSFTDQLKLSLEIRADSSAIKAQGTNKHIKSALMKMLDSSSNILLAPRFAKLLIEKRIDRMLNKKVKRQHRKLELLSSVVVASFLLGLFLLSNAEHAHASFVTKDTGKSCATMYKNMSLLPKRMTPAY